jgi:diadenosine tetraphosphate (Ap4A) HIT family hydrolase
MTELCRMMTELRRIMTELRHTSRILWTRINAESAYQQARHLLWHCLPEILADDKSGTSIPGRQQDLEGGTGQQNTGKNLS